MFDKLKAAASSGYAAAAKATSDAATAAKARYDIAAEAKKMVDEGGEPVAVKLLAKKGSRDTAAADKRLLAQLADLLRLYEIAVNQMTEAMPHAGDETGAFDKLSKEYNSRAAGLKTGLAKLNEVAALSVASISTVETDAISIVATKKNAEGLKKSVTAKLDQVSGKGSEAREGTASEGSGSMFASIKESAASNLTGAGQRVQAAMPGKKMVDEGGPPVAAKLLAKKASKDAVTLDESVVAALVSLAEAYDDTIEKLQSSAESASGETPSFATLAAEYASRAKAVRGLHASMLPSPAALPSSLEEQNGIVYLVATNQVTDMKAKASAAATDIQGKAAESAMGQALSKATGGSVTSVPEGTGTAAVNFARENPEQAKAAMQFAAKHASESSSK